MDNYSRSMSCAMILATIIGAFLVMVICAALAWEFAP
jgi:uncharacterized membrane protein YgaE (UPF0421/DUF939 family)